jgi:LytTr DNA-binding domain
MNTEPHAQIREMQTQIREPTAPASGDARTAWLFYTFVGLGPGITLALLGPFGSFLAPLWMRFAYWVPTMAIGAVIGPAITKVFDRYGFLKTRPLLQLAAKSIVMTALMGGVAWSFAWLVFGPGAVTLGVQFVFYVWLITVVMMAISTAILERAHRVSVAAIPAPATPAPTPATLVARLPDKLKAGAILALQGEDHYVRVHTDAGSDLILMRLADAIDGMGDTPGARTHRSWWVSKSALKTMRRDNGRVALVLSNDLEVPVSRGYASELKDAGWLQN